MTDTAKVKNISGEPLQVGWLGGRLVLVGEAVDVPLGDVYAYTQQTDTWAPYDPAAETAHQDGVDARADADVLDAALYEARFGTPQPAPEVPNTDPAQSVGAAAPVDVPDVTDAPPAADDVTADDLRGDALDQALTDRGLAKSGTADEKRARVAEYEDARTSGAYQLDAEGFLARDDTGAYVPVAEAGPVDPPDGTTPTSSTTENEES